jgi:small GTP-binding protein
VHRLITPEIDELLRRERALLEALRVHLARLEASDADLTLLQRSLSQLEELFLLVVVGEFNAGKTAFLNALLGDRLLAEGVTPTTSQVYLMRYGAAGAPQPDGDHVVVEAPVEWLREVNLVDTPGTNAVLLRHQQLTENFVPRCDLVLFVTSVDRPFTESERVFLERIRAWGKKIVIVLNKIDLLETEADLAEVIEFVRVNSRALLGLEPEIFPVSARLALQAKYSANGAGPKGDLWDRSRFAALEDYIITALDGRERMRLKLENPLGVARTLIERYAKTAQARQEVLRADFHTLDGVEAQFAAYQSDMRRDFAFQRNHVDNVLFELAERGDRFLDDTLRLGRLGDLINGEKVRVAFEREVLADTSQQVEHHVTDLIDWLVERDFRQWRTVMELLAPRSAEHASKLVGQVKSTFETDRETLLNNIRGAAAGVVASYDRAAETRKLTQEVQSAIVQTAAVEVGALGLGALLVALLQTTVLDVTGLLGAGVLAALGLYVLPYRRSRVKAHLRQRIGALREQLELALNRQFEQAMGESMLRLRDAIAPYTRFVRVEREKLGKLEADLAAAGAEIATLQAAAKTVSNVREPAL